MTRLLEIPKTIVPITEIPYSDKVWLFVKREDLIHCEISGNKYWKLFFNINNYLKNNPIEPMVITFGGAFSNHIAATASLGNQLKIKTIGIIRGEELEAKWQENPTLQKAHENGMQFQFVTRTSYRNKEFLTNEFQRKYPHALIIPEGGSDEMAVQGVAFMLDERTKDFDYLCTAVGTGGTLAGLSKFAENHQKVLGFKAVNDNVETKIANWSQRDNFQLFDAFEGGYAKINDDLLNLIDDFQQKFDIPLEPCYTGKMMKTLLKMIDEDFFPVGSKVLAFHTGGLQGIKGFNQLKNKSIKKQYLSSKY